MERRRLYDSRDIRGLQLSKKARLVEPAHGSPHQSDLPLAHISDTYIRQIFRWPVYISRFDTSEQLASTTGHR